MNNVAMTYTDRRVNVISEQSEVAQMWQPSSKQLETGEKFPTNFCRVS